MKKAGLWKSSLAFFLLLCILCLIPQPSALAATDPEIRANAAVLYEMNTGKTLYEKNAQTRIAPASTTKIMTALLAVEAYEDGRFTLDDMITAPDDLYFDITPDGSTQNIKAGEEMRFEDLMYCMLLASANESCNVIASTVEGTVAAFVEKMNTRAAELGCTGTHFVNTHGMPNEEHYTTAWDLCLIANAAMTHTLFEKIVSTEKWTTHATNVSPARELRNTNKLLDENSEYYYEFAGGIKTGYTNAAGYCLVSTATREGVRLLSVVMGAESVQTEDGRTQVQSYSESRRLLQWGFASFSYRTVLRNIELLDEIPILHGNGADAVPVRPQEDIVAFLDNDIPVESFTRTITKYYPTADGEELTAPVSAGDILGEVSVYYGGELLGTVKLVANRSVELQRLSLVKEQLHEILISKWVKITIAVIAGIFLLYFAFVIRYNIIRRKRKKARREAARRRAEELKRQPTTGKSFEDIEALYAAPAKKTLEDVEAFYAAPGRRGRNGGR